jgi:hypothetical protein
MGQHAPNTVAESTETTRIKNIQGRMVERLFLDQCSDVAQKKTEEAIRATKPWPFPFSLLQVGNPAADRSKMLAEIERDRKACMKDATVTPKKKYP